MSEAAPGLLSSVQVLTLTRGLYLVSVTSATPRRLGDDAELILPAIHVGPAPGASAQQIELMTGPQNNGHWLCEMRDMLVVKVSKGPANLLLTSVRTEQAPDMQIGVQRLDGRKNASAATSPPAPMSPEPGWPAAPSFAAAAPEGSAAAARSHIDLHLQNRGEVSFTDTIWAGELGEGTAIESFVIRALERARPDQIEYKGLTEAGEETDWIDAGSPCGSRGKGEALTGFAVRLKESANAGLECEYRGAFSSGKTIGPVRDGALCRGDDGDRLQAIQVQVTSRRPPASEAGSAIIGPVLPLHARPARRPPIGPRFSVFREIAG
ncbi:MAG TPA: hypothetical protein VGS12_05540 [Caulobacteraceae bacterium]|nr:hypothetical protein [Caulobacteraceae bacterium]